jgi:REP element-mobilizing transposase RayT
MSLDARCNCDNVVDVAHSKAHVVIHLVRGTKDRTPWIDSRLEAIIREVIAAQCTRLESPLLAFGASDDHVHCLIALSRKQSIVKFARAAKSASTVFVNRATAEKFAWQRGYGAFSVSERDPSAVLAYVRDQRDRHATNRIEPDWEEWWVDDDEGE